MPSSAPKSPSGPGSSLRAEAAAWIVARDRGFTKSQALEFKRWLAADPRHTAAIAEAAGVWTALSRIPSHLGQPIVDRSTRRLMWRWPALTGLAAAAALALLAWSRWTVNSLLKPQDQEQARQAVVTRPQTKLLADGTRVRLNVGTEIVEEFSASERRVRLARGEAYFIVTRDPARPFIVDVGEFTVHAVGTAFNVRRQALGVDVLVTEGKVEVKTPTNSSTPNAPPAPVVIAGQRAWVDVSAVSQAPRIVVSEVNSAYVAQALAWHEPLRNLGGATLIELAVDFERQTGRRLVVPDPELRELQVGGRFRSDDLEGLLRLLQENYGITSEHTADGTVVLRKAR